MNKLLTAFFWVALAVYAISLALPGLVYTARVTEGVLQHDCPNDRPDVAHCRSEVLSHQETRVDYGYSILASGFVGGFIGIYAWFSNLLFFGSLSLIRSRKFKGAMISSILGFFLGLQAFMLHQWPLDEGGVTEAHLQYLGIGYFVWLASFILLALYALLALRQTNSGSNIVH